MEIKNFLADNSRFGVVLSEVMKNHHVSGSDLMYYAGMIVTFIINNSFELVF